MLRFLILDLSESPATDVSLLFLDEHVYRHDASALAKLNTLEGEFLRRQFLRVL